MFEMTTTGQEINPMSLLAGLELTSEESAKLTTKLIIWISFWVASTSGENSFLNEICSRDEDRKLKSVTFSDSMLSSLESRASQL